MLSPIRSAVRWVGRHAFPVLFATVIAVGAAGGGIGYAVAHGHGTAAPVSATAPSTSPAPAAGAKAKRGAAGAGGTQVIQRALALLATQTGQSVASVRSQLEAGKSIDDIAGAKAPAIESEILAQVDKLASRAVSAGKISATQQATALAMVKAKVEALMAEPGTQLLQDAQKFLQFLHAHGAGHRSTATAPAPTPPA